MCVCVCVCSGVYVLGIASQPLGFAGPPTGLHNCLLIKPHCNSKVGVKNQILHNKHILHSSQSMVTIFIIKLNLLRQ